MAELSILAQATAVLALALIAARVTHRAPAAVRALLLASTFAVLLLLPVVALIVPGRTIEIPMADVSGSMTSLSEDFTPVQPVRVTAGTIDNGQPQWQFAMPSLSMIVRAVWISGTLLLVLRLAVALMQVRRMRRQGLPWLEGRACVQAVAQQSGIRRPVEMFLHKDLAAPITCGVLRPAVALPLDVPQWNEEELRHALIHELEHVRRGDWAVQLLARVACAIYWVHPLAWIAWRQLCVESERACDDAVLRRGERTAYAEQLVALARRLKSSPTPLLSMADRSNLATRVDAVLDADQARGRVGAVTCGLILSGALAVTAAISPFQVVTAATGPTAASPQAGVVEGNTRRLAFEVASIKRNRTSEPARARVEPGGRFTAVNAPVIQIIRQAYGVRPFQVLNAPDWTTSERYDILAKAPEGAPFGMGEVAPFLRALLRDRFAFSARMETHDMPIYALVAARPDRKPGPKLEPSPVDCTAPMPSRDADGRTPDKPPCAQLGQYLGAALNHRRYEMRGYPMSSFAQMLGGALDRLVVDKTGLTGTWNIELDFASDSAANPAPGDPPSIFTALQEQLGLKLEPARGPVEMLVIARIERPTED